MEVKRHTNRNIKHSGQYTFETMQVFPVMGVYNIPPPSPPSLSIFRLPLYARQAQIHFLD